jgi:hypothetical protein
MLKTSLAYYYGNSLWGIPEGKFSMGSPHDQEYVSGHYYVLYDTNNLHYIIDAVKV